MTTGLGMRVALGQLPRLSEASIAFARQLGVSGIQLNTPDLPGSHRWEASDLRQLRETCEASGLRLEAIENLPNHFYEHCMTGGPNRESEVEHVVATIRNLGEAGIPVLGYNFMPGSVWRTWMRRDGRGGALVNGFDQAVTDDPARADEVIIARRDRRLADPWVRGAHLLPTLQINESTLWEHYRWFMRRIVPAAEDSGVTLALHPDDPPVPMLGGVARLFRSVGALEEALDVVPSERAAIDLCLGTVSEMGGELAVLQAIQSLGPRGKICYVHFRDVKGMVPVFEECFLGEGNFRPLRVMRALRDSGFAGFILDDHAPGLVDDSDYGHRGRAHAIGYLQGLLEAISDEADVAASARTFND